MSTNNSLFNFAVLLALGTGAASGVTGYNYLQHQAQESFLLKQSYALQSNISQAIYLTERAAADSTYAAEIESLEVTIDRLLDSMQNGDPVRGISPAPSNVQANLSTLRAVWEELAPSFSQIISRRGSTDLYSRNLAEAAKAGEGTLSSAKAALSHLDGSGSELQKRLKQAVSQLEVGTTSLLPGNSVTTEALQASSSIFAQYVSELNALGSQLPKSGPMLESLIASYRGAGTTQVLIQKTIQTSSGAAENIPHAKTIWAARDRFNAATSGLVTSVEALPAARPYGIYMVFGLGAASVLLSVGAMLLMRQITTTRSERVEIQGRNLEYSTRNKSKEISTLLTEIGVIADGNLSARLTETNESTREIAVELNRMVGRIATIFDEVSHTISGLAAATEQASVTEQSVATNRAEQEKAITHVNQLIKGLLTFIVQIEQMTSSTDQISAEMQDRVRKGEQAVGHVHESAVILQQQTMAIQHAYKHLIESFQALENMSGVVSEAAAKTQLVSFQANLIADRLEDKGVAKTVASSAAAMERLASDTREAVVQINVVLKSMADAAQGTQKAVDAAQHETEQLRNRSSIAQSALSDISAMTGTLSNSVGEVIDGTKSMKVQSGEVGHTMDSIVHYTAENSAASEQTAVAVQGVNTQAQAVHKLIADFRKETA